VTFREPWEAQAFALAVSLQDRGVISASEWAAALGAEIAAAPDEEYYRCWLAALERLVDAREPGALARHRDAWARAAARTPHGKPIELSPSDF
jgi:nitrile hydratase accessory protein